MLYYVFMCVKGEIKKKDMLWNFCPGKLSSLVQRHIEGNESQVWWHSSVILPLQEAEAERFQVRIHPDQFRKVSEF